ncbi:MAG: DUF192 domain-containing protein [bacterium]|nr:DUF192 domain-containing protein [bacterium]
MGSKPTLSANLSRYFFVGVLLITIVSLITLSYKAPTSATAEFGGVSLRIDYATTPAEREKGLGDRTSVPADYGMLFVFAKDDTYGFWMKDTLVPLDMFWLDNKGQVVSIAQDVATSTYPSVFYPNMPARYVLETAAGFAQAHSVATGTPLLLKFFPTVSQ